MAYDEKLADRVRAMIGDRDDVTEQRMFGGLSFLIAGNMSVGVSGQGGLMVRLEPSDTEEALKEPGAQSFEMRGRSMDGWLRVSADVLGDDDDLRHWVDVGVGYASTLPPKQKK
jgi:TfoX/Sxy family transcriptional regulator of competence genes